MKIEIGREADGRWIAEVPDLAGVVVYGAAREDAVAMAESLALRVIADRLDHGEDIPDCAANTAPGPLGTRHRTSDSHVQTHSAFR